MKRRFPLLALVFLAIAVRAGAQTPATPGYADEPTPLPELPQGIIATPGTYTPRVGGYLQARETLRDGQGLTATLNRVRLSVDGRMPQNFSYRLQAEYASAASSPTGTASVSLRDGYIRWAYLNWSATAGQFKAPFSREYLMSLSTMETPDRAALENLGPKRDIGVMAEYLLIPDVTISAGVFNGEGQNASFNRDSTVMLVGRISSRPVPQVALGAAFTRTGTDSSRLGFEAGADFRGLALRGEFVRLTRDADARDEAWYGLATYRLAGGLSLVLRQEGLTRGVGGPALSTNRATTAGAFFDFPGGKLRAWVDYVRRTLEPGSNTEKTWIAQFQVRY